MTTFLKAYYVPGLPWGPRDEEEEGSVFEVQMPKVSCPGIRDEDEFGAN